MCRGLSQEEVVGGRQQTSTSAPSPPQPGNPYSRLQLVDSPAPGPQQVGISGPTRAPHPPFLEAGGNQAERIWPLGPINSCS